MTGIRDTILPKFRTFFQKKCFRKNILKKYVILQTDIEERKWLIISIYLKQ